MQIRFKYWDTAKPSGESGFKTGRRPGLFLFSTMHIYRSPLCLSSSGRYPDMPQERRARSAPMATRQKRAVYLLAMLLELVNRNGGMADGNANRYLGSTEITKT